MCCCRDILPEDEGPRPPRRPDSRGMSPSERRAVDLVWYIERILERVGLTDATLWAKRHGGHVDQVDVFDESTFRGEDCFDGKDRPPAPPQVVRGTEMNPRVYYPQVYHPKMIKWLLRKRLRRLLKDCTLPFGPIVFKIKRGKIDEIHPIDVYRPKKDGIDKLAKWFSDDPPENSPPGK